MMGNGFVYGLDHIEELVNISKENIKKNNSELLDSGLVNFKVCDGREGLKEFAPYDCIHIGAAVKEFPRDVLS